MTITNATDYDQGWLAGCNAGGRMFACVERRYRSVCRALVVSAMLNAALFWLLVFLGARWWGTR